MVRGETKRDHRTELDVIRDSGCFDENWYRERNKVDGGASDDAVRHYVDRSKTAPVDPHPLFDAAYYMERYPEWRASGLSPLGYYLSRGVPEGHAPNALFDPAWYRKAVGDLPAGADPFAHFLHKGALAGVSPHPLFDPSFYLGQREALKHGNISPLTHFVECGYKEGLWPNAYFDVSWYMVAHAAELGGTRNPLAHFIANAEKPRVNPHPELDLDRLVALPIFAGCSRLEVLSRILSTESLQQSFSVSGPHDVFRINSLDAMSHPTAAAAAARKDHIDLANGSETDAGHRVPEKDEAPLEIDIPEGAELVSFDVWDTLIRRDCHPDEIKLQSARALYLLAYNDILPAFRNVRTLLQARRICENRSSPNDEYEYRFDDALQRWLAMVLMPGMATEDKERIILAMRQHEIDSETRSTRPDVSALKRLNTLKQTSIFASDFYLPASFLDRLLRVHGFHNTFVTGYASSDAYLTKRSGRMFDRILADFSLEAAKLHHVGDNAHADDAVPKSKGIGTTLFVSQKEEDRKRWFATAFENWSEGDNRDHHRRLRAVAEAAAVGFEGTPSSELERIGGRLAPVVFGYCLNILEDALCNKLEKAFFFTREGVFFQAVFDRLVEANPFNLTAVQSDVLEVSRRATFAASLEDFSLQSLKRLWSLYSIQSMRGLAASLNLDAETVSAAAATYGIDFDKPVTYPWDDSRVKALFADAGFRDYVEAELAGQRALLEGYLRGKSFYDSPVQLVSDIGWRGTIQDNLSYVAPSVFTRGHYIGLFGYLNPQSGRTSKSGYVFDDNSGRALPVSEVGALEMIFNVAGGSVAGYERNGDGVSAVRMPFADEEAIVTSEVAALQRGMMSAIGPMADYVRLHGLMSADIEDLARDTLVALTTNPPEPIVDTFYRLHHNETFGTGELKNMGDRSDQLERLRAEGGSALHKAFSDVLSEMRWPEGSVRQKVLRDWWQDADALQKMAVPAEMTLFHSAPARVRVLGAGLCVYVPPPLKGSGGHRTIFNMVRRLADLGMRPHILLDGIGDGIDAVEHYLQGTAAVIHTQWHRLGPTDLAFATVAHSASYVAQLEHAANKAYLVQDYEALFNPMSDGYIIGENSYAQGLTHFTIGNWLSHVISRDYGASSLAAGLGVDTDVYHRDEAVERELAICFLYQPNKPRRTPMLGIEALRKLKAKLPDVTIYVYGSDAPVDLGFPVINLGMIRDLKDLNTLYNRCAVGLCISGSNPSRIPYEMMAAGCVPIDLYRYNNLLDHDDRSVMLAYQDSSSLAAAAHTLLTDETLRDGMSRHGMKTAASRTLRWEMDVVANGVLSMLDGNDLPAWTPSMRYEAPAIIAKESRSSPVEAFCKAQRQRAAS